MVQVTASSGRSPQRRQAPLFSSKRMLSIFVGICVVFSSIAIYIGVVRMPYLEGVLQDKGLRSEFVAPKETSSQVKSGTVAKPQVHKQLADDDAVVIAYAVSITGCGSDPLVEGAAVLAHSIHRVSSRGDHGGRYDYKLYAIYHPEALACTKPLEALGYTLLERNVFVKVEDIEGDYLRSKIADNGCCGEKELIKLEAYTLTDHPVFCHLDLDVLILKPLDELFDAMLMESSTTSTISRDSLQWADRELPQRIDAYYTHDYNMVRPHIKYKPVQGGFLVARPSMEAYEEYRDIVRKGDFTSSGGWGGQVGPFYGSMTFQGIVPYYYMVLHAGTAVELNRCIYNQMCDNPRTGRTINDVVQGECRTGATLCEDCRSRPLEDVATIHFTLCQKPWTCLTHSTDRIQDRLCRKVTHEWYKVRSELEISWGRTGQGPSLDWDHGDFFYGYCKSAGKSGYIPIQMPSQR